MRLLAVALAWVSLVSIASAVPIVYNSELVSGVPVAGVNTQAPGNQGNPIGSEFYSFYSDGVSAITIFGDRLEGHYDMSFSIYTGVHADTATLGAAIDFGDDEDPP